MKECDHTDCDFPAQFHAVVKTIGPITGVRKRHESGDLCQFHTNEAADQYNGKNYADVELSSI